jgi:hypothetical protein
MSNIINGTVQTENNLVGSLNATNGYDGKSAYEIAVNNGFEGTEEEWLASLVGKSGVYVGSGDMPEGYNVQIDPSGDVLTMDEIIRVVTAQINKISSVTLLASEWQGETSPYYQNVEISGTTENSKINLNPTVEQLNIFYNKDITFVAGNNKGVITVYCIGQKPMNDYTMQASITEVNVI